MTSTARRSYVPPRQPDAEQVCLLDKESAEQRQEAPEAFLAQARSKETRDSDDVVLRIIRPQETGQ